jgi:hemoglobin-like flavoprotein
MPDEQTELSEMEYDEVSLVGAGANQDANVILSKSRDDTEELEKFSSEDETGDTITSNDQEEAMPQINLDGLTEEQFAHFEDLQKDLDTALDVIDELTTDEEDQDTLEKSVADLLADRDARDAVSKSEYYEDSEESDEETVEETDDLEKIMKSNPAVRAAFEAQKQELSKAKSDAAEAVKITKAMHDQQLIKEAISKVRSDYANLPVEADQFGPVVKSAQAKLDTAEWEAIDTVLKAADEQVLAGKLFSTVGNDSFGGEVSKAEDQLEGLAKRRSEEREISYAQAYDEIIVENPSLYAQHVASEVN